MELDRSLSHGCDAPKLMDEEKISGGRQSTKPKPKKNQGEIWQKKKSMTTVVSKILKFDRLGTNRRKFRLLVVTHFDSKE